MNEFFAPTPIRGRKPHKFKPLEFYFPSERKPVEPTESIPLLHNKFPTREPSFVSLPDIKTEHKNF